MRTRKRFAIAHEIGHFYMPHHSGEHFQCTVADIARYTSENKFEREANEFASELLLRRGKLHENTYAFDYFACGALPDSPQQVLASAWCYDALPSQFIKEESIAFHRLGMVLSLLQMPDEVAEFEFWD